MAERDANEILARCERVLGPKLPATAAALLRAAADALPEDAPPDRYGEGEVVERLEARVAELLGAETAVLFPSGTMAQQIALRIHCERRGDRSVAFHPTCHLELHERHALVHLHGLRPALVGHRDRLLGLADLAALGEPLGALLLELPQRELGGLLPDWDDLVAQVEWARTAGTAVHLDGARLWEAGPWYGRPYAAIAGLFDTVYVSLYKILGGLGGCLLAGPRDVLAEARVWRQRHGGTLWNLFPLAASALPGLETTLPRMPELLAHARALADALGEVDGVEVVPRPPQTPLFHLHVRGDADRLRERALDVAAAERVWLFARPAPTQVPGVQKVELTVGVPALEVAPAEAAALFERVLG